MVKVMSYHRMTLNSPKKHSVRYDGDWPLKAVYIKKDVFAGHAKGNYPKVILVSIEVSGNEDGE